MARPKKEICKQDVEVRRIIKKYNIKTLPQLLKYQNGLLSDYENGIIDYLFLNNCRVMSETILKTIIEMNKISTPQDNKAIPSLKLIIENE